MNSKIRVGSSHWQPRLSETQADHTSGEPRASSTRGRALQADVGRSPVSMYLMLRAVLGLKSSSGG